MEANVIANARTRGRSTYQTCCFGLDRFSRTGVGLIRSGQATIVVHGGTLRTEVDLAADSFSTLLAAGGSEQK